jgi:hypothetical protein
MKPKRRKNKVASFDKLYTKEETRNELESIRIKLYSDHFLFFLGDLLRFLTALCTKLGDVEKFDTENKCLSPGGVTSTLALSRDFLLLRSDDGELLRL